jgi:hypothetical protein
MKELLTSLRVWIALQIGGEPPVAPEIQFRSQHELNERYYGGQPPADARLCGLYHAESKTIYLPTEWRPEVLADRASLLHELVHHVQTVRAMPNPCPAARERLAYQLQVQWLRENGVADPYALINIDEFTIAVHSLCPSAD